MTTMTIAAMTVDDACRALLDDYRSRPTLRAGSLITTVFGDSIAPRGGTVWLGSLIKAMAGFGISERLVRTSVFRLSQDGWLESEHRGRRSYYRLTGEGRQRFRTATHRIYRIYGEPASGWDGEWCLLLLSGLDATTRDLVRKECGWLGFAAMSTNVLAHPGPDIADLDETLRRVGVAEDVVVMSGRTLRNEPAMRTLVRGGWNLDDIDRRYEGFLHLFRPVSAAVSNAAANASTMTSTINPHTAFLVRTLLIQEYRKVLLRDPQLPEDLLPDDWHGYAAYSLCKDLYRSLWQPADAYLDASFESADGPLPKPDEDYYRRFGGLDVEGNSKEGRQR